MQITLVMKRSSCSEGEFQCIHTEESRDEQTQEARRLSICMPSMGAWKSPFPSRPPRKPTLADFDLQLQPPKEQDNEIFVVYAPLPVSFDTRKLSLGSCVSVLFIDLL